MSRTPLFTTRPAPIPIGRAMAWTWNASPSWAWKEGLKSGRNAVSTIDCDSISAHFEPRTMSEKILFVDDDPNLLAACERNLRRQFQLETATAARAGLD